MHPQNGSYALTKETLSTNYTHTSHTKVRYSHNMCKKEYLGCLVRLQIRSLQLWPRPLFIW